MDKSKRTKLFKVIMVFLMLGIGTSVIGLIGLVFAFFNFTASEIVISVVAVLLAYGSILMLWTQTSKLTPEIWETPSTPPPDNIDPTFGGISVTVSAAFTLIFMTIESLMIYFFIRSLFF